MNEEVKAFLEKHGWVYLPEDVRHAFPRYQDPRTGETCQPIEAVVLQLMRKED